MTDALIYFSLFQNKREKLSKIVFCRLYILLGEGGSNRKKITQIILV